VDWSEKRQRDVLDRMILRGISRQEILAAIRQGAKRRQREGVYEAVFRYSSIVYEERHDSKRRWRKVYPITVKVGP